MRVSVDLQRRSMSSPSSMSNSDVTRQVVKVEFGVDFVNFSLGFLDVDFSVGDGGFAHGVVTTVFESFQCCVYQWCSISMSQDASEDSTHVLEPRFASVFS